MDRLDQFVDDVVAGRAVVGELTRLAVERHIRDVDSGTWLWDEDTARRSIRFFEMLRHWKGRKAGSRIRLEPHQVFRIASIWGWRDDHGMRRFRRALYMVARKNAKTTEAAGNAIMHLYFDKENGAQVWSTATKEGQARIVINDIGRIATATPEISGDFNLYWYRDEVTRVAFRHKDNANSLPRTGSATPLGQDSKTQDGIDPSWGIVDEYHEHKDATRYNIIESGMGARSQPFMETITTAGFNKSFPCYATMRDTAIKVLRGQLTDDRFFPVIYELDTTDDWNDSDVWVKANPNLNVSVMASDMESRYIKAKNEGGATEVDFKTKNLNMWVDSASAWVSDEAWMSCVASDELAIGPCFGGLDLAPVRDFSCLALFFPETKYVKVWTWINAANFAQRYEKYGVDLHKWRDDGWLIVTDGNTTDFRRIESDILGLRSKYDIRRIGYDRAHASQLVMNLTDEGIDMSAFSQQPLNMIHPTSVVESGLVGGELAHEGNPVMRWMMSNVMAEIGNNNDVVVKKKRATDKIDGVIAMIMAIGEAMTPDEDSSEGGVTFIEF